jgi:hypothetical protein
MPAEFRCRSCNSTDRFEVVRRHRTRYYYHLTLGGEQIDEDDVDVLEDVIESVRCLWCDPGTDVEILDDS